jgi:hypothetical protein
VLRRKYFAATAILGTFLVLNAGGLALPGVDLNGAVRTLGGASATWTGLLSNGSLVKVAIESGLDPLVAQGAVLVALFGVMILMVAVQRSRALSDPLPWLIIALLAIPLSWISYDVVLLPALAALLIANTPRGRLIGMAGWALWVAPTLAYSFAIIESGVSSLAVRVLLLAAWWLSLMKWHDDGLHSTWSDRELPSDSAGHPSTEPEPRLATGSHPSMTT